MKSKSKNKSVKLKIKTETSLDTFTLLSMTTICFDNYFELTIK